MASQFCHHNLWTNSLSLVTNTTLRHVPVSHKCQCAPPAPGQSWVHTVALIFLILTLLQNCYPMHAKVWPYWTLTVQSGRVRWVALKCGLPLVLWRQQAEFWLAQARKLFSTSSFSHRMTQQENLCWTWLLDLDLLTFQSQPHFYCLCAIECTAEWNRLRQGQCFGFCFCF